MSPGACACSGERGESLDDRAAGSAAMQIERPDPGTVDRDRDRDNFHLALRITLGFLALLWLVQLSNWALDLDPGDFGIRPRMWAGLPGILLAPLQHGGFAHLIANSVPLLVLGTAMLYLYPKSALRVLPAVYFGPGVAVWLFARGSVHIGASGIVYGLISYILVAGVIRRDRRAIAASLLVTFLYGAAIWGVLPIQRGVSWETHLAGAVIGLVMAIALRRLDMPRRTAHAFDDDGTEGLADE